METLFHPADQRGCNDLGWLNTCHSFSFAGFYDPGKMGFGALRVLNDDEVAPAQGFGMHPHDNMEIVSIPLEGSLLHEDNMGHRSVIKEGDVQVMSAGTGVIHSEFNYSSSEPVKFLQIWVFPEKEDVEPRYGQKYFENKLFQDRFYPVIEPTGKEGLWLYQQTWFSLAKVKGDHFLTYNLYGEGTGVYLFMLEGQAELNGQTLKRRDAMGIWNTDKFDLECQVGTSCLAIEVPM